MTLHDFLMIAIGYFGMNVLVVFTLIFLEAYDERKRRKAYKLYVDSGEEERTKQFYRRRFHEQVKNKEKLKALLDELGLTPIPPPSREKAEWQIPK